MWLCDCQGSFIVVFFWYRDPEGITCPSVTIYGIPWAVIKVVRSCFVGDGHMTRMRWERSLDSRWPAIFIPTNTVFQSFFITDFIFYTLFNLKLPLNIFPHSLLVLRPIYLVICTLISNSLCIINMNLKIVWDPMYCF